MKTSQARQLGARLSGLIQAGNADQAYALLSPVLAERTPFAALRLIGGAIGSGPLEAANPFLDRIAADRTEGGWAVIGGALRAQLDRDLAGALARCRVYVIAADIWYAPGILGETVLGPALIDHFQPTLARIAPWRADENRWVRRTVGHGVHFWAKRSRGAEEFIPQATALLDFLEPMFGEWDMDALKGIGWGLKTVGKHYPDQMAAWLEEQVIRRQRRHRTLMLRKALTYLPADLRARFTGDTP